MQTGGIFLIPQLQPHPFAGGYHDKKFQIFILKMKKKKQKLCSVAPTIPMDYYVSWIAAKDMELINGGWVGEGGQRGDGW